MKKLNFNNSKKYWDKLYQIQQSLFQSPIIGEQEYFEFSTNIPKGDLETLRAHELADLKRKSFKYDFFEIFSSVAVLPIGRNKVFIFKSLGRIPWEFRLINPSKNTRSLYHPCIVYWKEKLFEYFPDRLLKEYPTIYLGYFWNSLSKIEGAIEIPLSLVRDNDVHEERIGEVRGILMKLGVLTDKRKLNKASIPFTQGCKAFVLKKYQKLCKNDPKLKKRYPIKILQHYLDDKAHLIQGDESRKLPNDATINRWLNSYNLEQDKATEKRRDAIQKRKILQEFDHLLKERKKKIRNGKIAFANNEFIEGLPVSILGPP